MLFHPIINQLANIDLLLIKGVKAADKQSIEGQTACFCPFCKEKSGSPHFILYTNERGGLYDGTGVDGIATKGGAVRWMCTKTKRQGYGAIELYAAIHNIPLHGRGLMKACHDLVVEVYGDSEQVRGMYPMLFGNYDYRTVAAQTIDTFSFMPKADFNPQELTVLGCEVHQRKGVITYGFGADFSPSMLNDDFRIYSLDHVVLPNVVRDGKLVSEIIHGTPWNPLFVCFATNEISPMGSCGCFFRPAMSENNIIVFSTDEKRSVNVVSKWLGGDKVFNYYIDRHTPHASMNKLSPDEVYTETQEVWVDSENQKGNPIVVKELQAIPTEKIRAKNIIYCQTPQDAIATYYMLRSLRVEKIQYEQRVIEEGEELQSRQSDELWYHVAFLMGKKNYWYIDHGEWKQSEVEFDSAQNRKLTRFAERVVCLFPNDMRSQRIACSIALRFTAIHLSFLPDNFRKAENQKMQWLYGAKVHTVRDFMLSYQMLDEESFLNAHSIRNVFSSIVATARPACPLQRKEKRNVNNILKEVYYIVDTANIWTYLLCIGLFRAVDPLSDDKVGQYVQLNGPFVTPITKESVVMFANKAMKDFADRLIAINPMLANEHPLMLQGIAHSKDVNEKSISNLHAVELNFKGAYGPDVDHFFYKNGALRITKNEIKLIPYKDVQFNIDPRAVLDWNYTDPCKRGAKRKEPFVIYENPEYKERKARVDAMQNEVDAEGNLIYTQSQIGKAESELEVWSRIHRWKIDWFDQNERELWGCLRVIRGMANIDWMLEEERIRCKQKPSEYDVCMLNSHVANFLFAIGRMLYMYHGDASISAPYLMENTVKDNRRASGGSGKSTLVNIFAACSGKVLKIDCKKITNGQDLRFIMQEYIPNVHRIIHWEDWAKGFSIKFVYNYVTSGMQAEQKHEKSESRELDESPNHVVSSNYPLSDSDDSTVGRFPLVPFSDRFARANAMLNKPARKITDVMPDFTSGKPDNLSATSRNQIAYINALAVQFLMRNKEIVNAPLDDVKQRQLVAELSEPMVRYMTYFFSQSAVFGEPQDLKSMFKEFVRDFTDSSDAKKDGYALRTFKEKCQQWCEFNNIVMNPPHLIETKADVKTGYFHLQAWVTKEYFADSRWQKDPDRHPVYVRELDRTDNACLFFRQEDTVPVSYDEFKQGEYRDFLLRPDPLPILDDMGNKVIITEQEKLQSVAGPSRSPAPIQQPQPVKIEIDESELPF